MSTNHFVEDGEYSYEHHTHRLDRERAGIEQTPGSLRATLHALSKDHDFLLKGDVFTTELIESYIEYKLEYECDAVDLRPHPYEFYLYADN